DFFCQAEDGIRDFHVTGVQTCALPIYMWNWSPSPKYSTTSCGHWLASASRRPLGYFSSKWRRSFLQNSWVFGRFSQFVPSSSNRSEERRVGKEWNRWQRARQENTTKHK